MTPHTVTVPARRVYRVGDECSDQSVPWTWRKSQMMHERGTGHKTHLFAYNWPKINEGSSG